MLWTVDGEGDNFVWHNLVLQHLRAIGDSDETDSPSKRQRIRLSVEGVLVPCPKFLFFSVFS